jgi:hypothetical protein
MSATIGTGDLGTISARPSAASTSLQVIRTMSAPVAASAYTWASVPSTSAVFVVVIDWTVTGAPPPTGTSPTRICRVSRRSIIGPMLGTPRSHSQADRIDDVEDDRHDP